MFMVRCFVRQFRLASLHRDSTKIIGGDRVIASNEGPRPWHTRHDYSLLDAKTAQAEEFQRMGETVGGEFGNNAHSEDSEGKV